MQISSLSIYPYYPLAFLIITTMAQATKIIRRSIHAFSRNYQPFATTTTIFLIVPFSILLLLSQSFASSSSIGFPASSSQLFLLIVHKLSQTIFSLLLILPFTLTFFVLAKASVIQTMLESSHRQFTISSFSSLFRLYFLLLPTSFFNAFIVLSANAAVLSLLLVALNTLGIFGLSSSNYIVVLITASAVVYSVMISNTTVACNLATVVSAMENCRGYLPFFKACVLVRGNKAAAIMASLPTSLGMAATEALFQYRIARPYDISGLLKFPAVGEAFLIAYMYSLLIVIDTIVSFMLYRSFKSGAQLSGDQTDIELSLEGHYESLQF